MQLVLASGSGVDLIIIVPKSRSTDSRPVVRPNATILLAISAALLASGLALLVLGGNTKPETIAAYLLLSLMAATVTFGFLGATGLAHSRNWQLGGSAGVFGAILAMLLPFVGDSGSEIRGVVLLDQAPVREATLLLLGADPSSNTRQLTPADNGQFRFAVLRKRPTYEFQVTIPNWGATNLVIPAKEGLVKIELTSRPAIGPRSDLSAQNWDLCKPDDHACTLFLFDYFRSDTNQINDSQLQAFHNFQIDRLDKGIRNHLLAQNLLGEETFRVKRCSSAAINDPSLAGQAAAILKVPAVLWGYLSRADNRLRSVMTITMVNPESFTIYMPEALGSDVMDLIESNLPLKEAPLAIASFMLGETYRSQRKPELARRAFLHAQELMTRMESPSLDFRRALEERLRESQAANPALALAPIGG